MELKKAVCNSWYYLNGNKACSLCNTTGCRMGTDVACGMYDPPLEQGIKNGGWECPRCHKINAFWVRQCDCPPLTISANTVINIGQSKGEKVT